MEDRIAKLEQEILELQNRNIETNDIMVQLRNIISNKKTIHESIDANSKSIHTLDKRQKAQNMNILEQLNNFAALQEADYNVLTKVLVKLADTIIYVEHLKNDIEQLKMAVFGTVAIQKRSIELAEKYSKKIIGLEYKAALELLVKENVNFQIRAHDNDNFYQNSNFPFEYGSVRIDIWIEGGIVSKTEVVNE